MELLYYKKSTSNLHWYSNYCNTKNQKWPIFGYFCQVFAQKPGFLPLFIYLYKNSIYWIYIYINNDYQYDIFNILNDCKFDRYYANNVWVNKQKTFDYIRYNNKPTGVKSSNLYNIYTSGYSVYKIF